MFYPSKDMNTCQNCNWPIFDSQVICMHCGTQVKPLEIKLKIFGARRRHLVLIQHPPLADKNIIRWKYRESKLKVPKGNMTLDHWF